MIFCHLKTSFSKHSITHSKEELQFANLRNLENARTEIRKGIPLSWTISIWSKVKSGNDAFWNPKERLARRAMQILMQNYLCNWISAYSPSMLLNFHSKFPPGRGIQLKYLPETIKTTLQGNETSTFRLHRLSNVFLIR